MHVRNPIIHAAAVLMAAALLLPIAACGGGTSDTDIDWSINALIDPDAGIEPVLVTSRVGVGETRLAFALFDNDRNLIDGAETPRLRLFTIDDEDRGTLVTEADLHIAQLVGEGTPHAHADGSDHLHEGPTTTVYAATAQLTQPGWWGAELRFDLDGRARTLRYRFSVAAGTPEPAIGAPAPPSRQLLLADVEDIALVDTSTTPNPALHQLTVADAVATGRPTVIAFATPLFCQTRFCGPVVEQVVSPVWDRYGSEVNVLHIEPYDVTRARTGELVPVPSMLEWHLQTEPWIFVLDREGRVLAKFEGIMSLEEVSAAVDRALADR